MLKVINWRRKTSIVAVAITLLSLLTVISPNNLPRAFAVGDGLKAFYVNDVADATSKASNWSNNDVVINPAFKNTCGTETITSLTLNWGSTSNGTCQTDNFSMYATGYILAPKAGSVTFTGSADDAAVLRINGTTVLSKLGTAGSFTNGSFTFEANKIYAIQVFFYENGGGASLTIRWNPNGSAEDITSSYLGTSADKFSGVSNQVEANCAIGSSPTCPAYSAQEIYNLYETTTDTGYWILVGGVATYEYVLFSKSSNASDSRGWVLAAKAPGTGSDFAYSDTYKWINPTTINHYTVEGTNSTTQRISGSNTVGKYDSFNGMYAEKIRAYFANSSGTIYTSASYGGRYTDAGNAGFTWEETIVNGLTGVNSASATTDSTKASGTAANCSVTSSITLLTLFSTANRCMFRSSRINASYSAANSNTASYDPIGNGLFASQRDVRFFGINYNQPAPGGSPNAYHKARFGFGWNENGNEGTGTVDSDPSNDNETSNDATGGIGIEYNGTGTQIPTGSHKGCCTTQDGINGSANGSASQMGFEIYIRQSEPNLTVPTNLAVSRTGATSVNLTWSPISTTGTKQVEYVVQYKDNATASWSGAQTYRVLSPSATPSAAITGLTAGTTYNFRVFSRTLDLDSAGQIFNTNSSATAASITVAPLSTPTSVSAAATTGVEKSITLTWNSVSNASSYTVKVYPTSSLGTPSQTITGVATSSNTGFVVNSSNFSAITVSTIYYFTVTAVGNGTTYLTSNESSYSSATTLAKVATSTVTASTTSGALKSFDISWTKVLNISSYTLKMYSSDQSTLVLTIPNISSSALSRTITSSDQPAITDSTTYYFSITALASAGYANGDESTKVSATSATKLTTPSITVAATANNLKSLTASWTTVSNADNYTLKLYDLGGTLLTTVPYIGTLTYVINSNTYSLTDSTQYRVSLIAKGSGLYVDSDESGLVSGTTLAAATAPIISSQPIGVSKVAGDYTSFSVVASTSNGSLSYQWQVSTDSATTFTNIAGATGSTYFTPVLTTADNGNYFRVVVTNTYLGSTATSTSNAVQMAVGKANPTITINTENSFTPTYGQVSRLITTTSKPGTVEFKVDTTVITGCEAVATTLSGSNYVANCDWTATTGTHTFYGILSPTDTSNYNSVTGSSTKTTNAASQPTITITSTSGTYGSPLTLTISGGGDGALTFSIGNSGTAGCSNSATNNILTFTSSGTCTVRASIAASTKYNSGYSDVTTINVSKATQATITISTVSANYNATLTLAIPTTGTAGGGSGNGTVTYQLIGGAGTANCAIGTVSNSTAPLTATTPGTCVVRATRGAGADNKYFSKDSDDTTITFNKLAQATLTITPTSGSFGTTFNLGTSGGNGDGLVSYSLSAAGSAGCSINGSVLAYTSAGTCTITATKAEGTYYLSKTSSITTMTISSVAQLALYVSTIYGTGGTPLTLATIGGSGNGAISYSVTNGTNTTCSLVGTQLTATTSGGASGSCIVTATKAADSGYTAKSSAATTIFFTAYTVTVDTSPTCPSGTLTSNSGVCMPLTINTSTAPKITTLSASSGLVGSSITITGTAFTGATKVQFGVKIAVTFSVVSDTSISATVPTGATTGRIIVATPGGTAFSPTIFTITVPDTQAPSLVSAIVNTNTPTQIILSFDESLASTSTSTTAFAITVAGSSKTISTVTISGSTVTLVITSAVTNGQSVSFTYTSPGDSTSIQDAAGNKTATIGSTAVTNSVS